MNYFRCCQSRGVRNEGCGGLRCARRCCRVFEHLSSLLLKPKYRLSPRASHESHNRSKNFATKQVYMISTAGHRENKEIQRLLSQSLVRIDVGPCWRMSVQRRITDHSTQFMHMYQFIDRVPHELLEDVSAITDHSTRQACPSRTFDRHPTSSCRQSKTAHTVPVH